MRAHPTAPIYHNAGEHGQLDMWPGDACGGGRRAGSAMHGQGRTRQAQGRPEARSEADSCPMSTSSNSTTRSCPATSLHRSWPLARHSNSLS